ncbi:MAG: 30S ribosomal protein S7 [Candidatus Spechtbacteria bacterium RIFCSPLOWO2_12_FULL_38_22]|uniref:Small ribosomal subunit protein uS7 n=1 Tax=Candidatus Spechtbacteria bacterium RIFCSPLOWO2_12_FULL_38_22 TaxID=1802165 RepID=A0A1G2HI51_9BACT|nr:MAG: 30S ribosomal protein S7 [Candidatus Spechtbacteria bacterium RIFCSPHIGHO2_01_FULL_38_11]OGZ59284.1 MAG: 30S ribosomal protein S7 [Candidatus Spechtbacteria bacterium RIFCSPHIGHO2_12_FULL_38_30]OGZ60754.1 MAG: 30S ribosomal protein S7 [Candidatus Spechtbacteria bacterium RIFCSPLOWO2_01_FULL_38_20]OGZ62157.1 MAG: 30S ribosomal protein S7 [Candidatus Spechtbacteria bacterium RIFCSPLOWO2_12_FULL_38_22]
MRKNTKIKKQPIQPDYKYNNPIVTKFINYAMWEGKKSVARTIVYEAFDTVAQKSKKDAMDIFDLALKNVAPTIEVVSKRVGGANYQVPRQVKGERRDMLAMRWIISAARSKKGVNMGQKLAQVLLDSANNEGDAMKKKENVEKMARANRAFAHFA